MDLWNLFARLGERKLGLAAVIAVSLVLGVLGWTTSQASYSLTAQQALRTTQQTAEGTVTTTGGFELGMMGAMLVQNTQANAGGFGDAIVTSSNAVVSPPAALPLVTTTVVAESDEEATAALESALRLNHDFLDELLEGDGVASSVSLIDLPYNTQPAVSAQPRLRSAGIGVILGGMVGLTSLVIFDVVRRRGGGRNGKAVGTGSGEFARTRTDDDTSRTWTVGSSSRTPTDRSR